MIIPPGAITPENMTLSSSDGDLTYTFDKNGTLMVQTDAWITSFVVTEGASQMVLELVVKGTASGKYTVKDGYVTLEKITDNRLQYAAVLDDYAMIDTSKAEEFALLFKPPMTSLKFICTRESLRLTVEGVPGVSTPVAFTRK